MAMQVEFERRYAKGVGFQLMYMLHERHQGGIARLVRRFFGSAGKLVPAATTVPTDHDERMRAASTPAILRFRSTRSVELDRRSARGQGQGRWLPNSNKYLKRHHWRLAGFRTGPLEDQLLQSADLDLADGNAGGILRPQVSD
jgi:hypothetical protein